MWALGVVVFMMLYGYSPFRASKDDSEVPFQCKLTSYNRLLVVLDFFFSTVRLVDWWSSRASWRALMPTWSLAPAHTSQQIAKYLDTVFVSDFVFLGFGSSAGFHSATAVFRSRTARIGSCLIKASMVRAHQNYHSLTFSIRNCCL